VRGKLIKTTTTTPIQSRGHPVVLRGIRIVGGAPTDMRIQDGRIAGIIPSGNAPGVLSGDAIIADAHGLIALPGFVDLHTHLREPAIACTSDEVSETIATGTRAAAAGGYIDVFAMANTNPVCDSADRVRDVVERAQRDALTRVHVVGAITRGLCGQTLAPIEEMAAAGARMFSDDGHCVDDPALLREALAIAARRGLVVAQHAQDGSLAGRGQINESRTCCDTGLTPWPAAAEEIVIARDVVLAGHTGAALHICHLSTAGSVEIVRWAKSRGWRVTAEVTPHHLLLSDELAALTDPLFKVNPPLRTPEDVTALRAALLDGTIDAVATDHAPHTASAKARSWTDAPFGMTGLETALPVVARVLAEENGGQVDWHHLVTVMSTSPARIGGIADRAGRPLAVGEAASFCLVDPAVRWTVDPARQHSRSANTPFRGTTFDHRVVATYIDGIPVHGPHPQEWQ
jgi:dihydroorotase